MSSPPRTPHRRPASSHRRHPSSIDMSHTSPSQSHVPASLTSGSRRQSLHRQSSAYSLGAPLTPQLSREFEHSSPGQHFHGGGDGGLGNLADELGDLDGWDSQEEEGVEGEDYEGEEYMDGEGEGLPQENGHGALDYTNSNGDPIPTPVVNGDGVRDSGVVMQSSSPDSKRATLSPGAAAKQSRRHQRQRSLYDGSDYGGDSDLEENGGIPAGLQRQMGAIEGLVRRGLEENGSASDQVVKRVVERLRDLGSQTTIESGATRLKTAHDALATHLTHQSRMLTSLTASFTGPRAIYPSASDIETLTPLITSTLELLPHSSPDPLFALNQLTSSTRELLQHFSNVSDSLHMSRQAHNDAARRLRVAKEQVADWKKEVTMREEGMMFIEKGDWEKRLGEREAERVCGDVVGGFEEVCGMWRKRLCEGLGIADAVASA